jgi:hypothetical protein
LIFYKCRSWQLHKAFFLAFFCKKTFNFEITIFWMCAYYKLSLLLLGNVWIYAYWWKTYF